MNLNKIPHVEDGEFISAESYNRLVDVANAILGMRYVNGRVQFAAEGIRLQGSGSGGSDDPSPDPSPESNFDFRGRYDDTETYSIGSVVVYDGQLSQDTDLARLGTYISLTDDNVGNYPPSGAAIINTHWATLAVGHADRTIWGNPTGEIYNENNNYTYIDNDNLFMRGDTGFGETEGVPNVAQVNVNPLALSMTGERNTLTFQTNMEYDSYGINLAPVKLAICIGGETRYLHVLGMITTS